MRRKNLCWSAASLNGAYLLCFVLAMVISPANLAAGKWQGKESERDGVRYVTNPSTGMQSDRSIGLKELWRIGGDTDDDDEIFGVISRIITDNAGNVYLLDSQLSEVKVFSPDGEYLRTIGREGEGPGEFMRASSMFFTPSGQLGVLQGAPGRIVLLTRDGAAAGDFPIPAAPDGGFLVLAAGLGADDHLVLHAVSQVMKDGGIDQIHFLVKVNAQGEEVARYQEEMLAIDFMNPEIDETKMGSFHGRWALGRDGRVYAVATHSAYEVQVWQADGTPAYVIEREFERRKRTPEEKQRVYDIFEGVMRGVPNAKITVSDYETDVTGLYVRDNGELWVVNSRGRLDRPDGAVSVFDVFDDRGRFVRSVTLEGQGDPLRDAYYFIGDRFFVVSGVLDAAVAMMGGGGTSGDGAAEPMSVICYEVDG